MSFFYYPCLSSSLHWYCHMLPIQAHNGRTAWFSHFTSVNRQEATYTAGRRPFIWTVRSKPKTLTYTYTDTHTGMRGKREHAPVLLLMTSTMVDGKQPTRSFPVRLSWIQPFQRPSGCCSKTCQTEITADPSNACGFWNRSKEDAALEVAKFLRRNISVRSCCGFFQRMQRLEHTGWLHLFVALLPVLLLVKKSDPRDYYKAGIHSFPVCQTSHTTACFPEQKTS